MNDAIAQYNKLCFMNMEKSVFERYKNFRNRVPYSEYRDAHTWPDRYSTYAVIDAVTLFATGHGSEANYVLSLAEAAANDALAGKVFDHGNSMTSVYDDNTAEALGMANCLETLHYVKWFSTNERPLDLWGKALVYYEKYFNLWFKKDPEAPFQRVMLRYVIAKDFKGAIDWYKARYKKALTEPTIDKRYIRGQLHVLYGLSEYQLGNTQIANFVKAGLFYWHERSRDRKIIDSNLLNYDRLNWIYLWLLYFTNNSDPMTVVSSYRGY